MNHVITLAIDPGKGGAIAICYGDGKYESHKFTTAADMAMIVFEAMDYAETEGLEVRCLMEKVHSFPGQGVASTFAFGENFGIWQGILAAYRVPYKLVSPKKWQKCLGGLSKNKTERKNQIKAYVQRALPKMKINLANADALAMLLVLDKVW